jgi:hypothetical protein
MPGKVNGHRDDIFDLDPRFDLLEVEQALEQEKGATDQQERQRDFARDNGAPNARLPAGGAAGRLIQGLRETAEGGPKGRERTCEQGDS